MFFFIGECAKWWKYFVTTHQTAVKYRAESRRCLRTLEWIGTGWNWLEYVGTRLSQRRCLLKLWRGLDLHFFVTF